jgi:hypothetical protein
MERTDVNVSRWGGRTCLFSRKPVAPLFTLREGGALPDECNDLAALIGPLAERIQAVHALAGVPPVNGTWHPPRAQIVASGAGTENGEFGLAS